MNRRNLNLHFASHGVHRREGAEEWGAPDGSREEAWGEREHERDGGGALGGEGKKILTRGFYSW